MEKPTLADILALSLTERTRHAQALWDSIADVPESVPLTPSEREIIARRLEAYYRDPEAGSSWAEVKARVLGRARG
jgi:putative addiction module component (TIGR02574 family)